MPPVTGHADSAELAHAVSQVARASARDDTLPLLTTILVEFAGDQISLTATDRYRLAARTLSWAPETPDVAVKALVKAKTLTDMTKSLSGGGDVAISLVNEPGAA